MSALVNSQQMYAQPVMPGFASTTELPIQATACVLGSTHLCTLPGPVKPATPAAMPPAVAPAAPAASSLVQPAQGTVTVAPAAVAMAAAVAAQAVPSLQSMGTATAPPGVAAQPTPAVPAACTSPAPDVPAAADACPAAAVSDGSKDWLYHLVTFPAYFTPCPHCCGGNRTPKREQLITHFDIEEPFRVYCSHCPEHKTRGPALLQVRRSAFKDVVKAVDILRFGADVAGVQQYTLNGSKVIYLNREATNEKKSNSASAAPATCTVDGRAMMDKTSLYCSLKCKMQAEDPGFTAWLNRQDPQLVAASVAAANAPPRPTMACKRASSGAPPSCISGLSLPAPTGPRAKKAPKLAGTETVAESLSSGGKVSPQKRSGPAKATKVCALLGGSSSVSAAAGGATSGGSMPSLPRIRTHPSGAAAHSGTQRFSSAPPGFLDAAMGATSMQEGAWASGGLSSSGALERAYSSSAAWGFQGDLPEGTWAQLKSPAFGSGFDSTWGEDSLDSNKETFPSSGLDGRCLDGSCWGDDGSLSPKLINTNMGPHSSGSTFDWWLPGAKPEGEFGSCVLGGADAGLLSWPGTDCAGYGLLGDSLVPQAGPGQQQGPTSSQGLTSSEGSEEVTTLPEAMAERLMEGDGGSVAGSPARACEHSYGVAAMVQ